MVLGLNNMYNHGGFSNLASESLTRPLTNSFSLHEWIICPTVVQDSSMQA